MQSPHARPIVLFSFSYPPADGGIARLCGELTLRLRMLEHPIIVIARSASRESQWKSDVAEIRVPSIRIISELTAWWNLVWAAPARLVICGRWYPEGLIALLSGQSKLIVLAHGLELGNSRNGYWAPIKAILMRYVLKRVQLVVSNSTFTERLVRRVCPDAKTISFPLAVDTARFFPGNKRPARQTFNIAETDFVVLTVARLVKHKGHSLVLQAISVLPAEIRRRTTYLVAGRGNYKEQLAQEARNLGIQINLRLIGFVQDDILPALYRCADVFALCSTFAQDRAEVEGFGMVLLEAQASAIPVVATRTGGIPEAVIVEAGNVLIENNDVDGLCKTLIAIYQHRGEYEKVGLRSRSAVCEQNSWSAYIKRFRSATYLD